MKIIAEIGSNWKNLDDILFSVAMAKGTGAHAVKFQLFTPADMYPNAQSSNYGVTPHLAPHWLPEIKKACMEHEIEFMCTGFSQRAYNLINPLVETHKIASAEITDWDILGTVNSFKKPVYLSTGGATLGEIDTALRYLKQCHVTIMYCVTDYPARVVDFRHLETLREHFGSNYSYGYSDHSLDVLNIPNLARMHGCSVIEKHVNYTHHKDTDDAPHSLDAHEFGLMTRRLMGEDITLRETFRPCPWKRKQMVLPDGSEGFYRVREI